MKVELSLDQPLRLCSLAMESSHNNGPIHLRMEEANQDVEEGCCSYREMVKRESSNLEETSLNVEIETPFLQMLQAVEPQSFSQFSYLNTNFEQMTTLLQQKMEVPWEQIQGESCVTHEALGLNSPSGNKQDQQLMCSLEGNSVPQTAIRTRERRKRKRTRNAANNEEAEHQRMTHIAVERNRRRLMNDHLAALRSLMPSSYVQRGDQASIIGGAIDFVKELEQMLESLQAQKIMQQTCGGQEGGSHLNAPEDLKLEEENNYNNIITNGEEEAVRGSFFNAELKSSAADVQVTVVQNHANLKIQCDRRQGQLLKAIVALENLKLTVLHLNVTSLQESAFYSFSLKIEEDCKVGKSAREIAEAVHQIFSFIYNQKWDY